MLTRSSGLSGILHTYSYAYTAAHDFGVSDRIMADDYVLRMGPHEIRGRAEEYQPATRRQYEQFPTLGFTVHDLLNNGERAALHFTEHGRSAFTGGLASWQGISLYRWNGEQLTECRVEQDYYSRKWQLSSGTPSPVRPPGIDPWSDPDRSPRPAAERWVRDWLVGDRWLRADGVEHDDGSGSVRLDEPSTQVLDLFSAGDRVAFHVRCSGRYAGGLPDTEELLGRDGTLFAAGIVTVGQNQECVGTVITDRYSFLRRLRDAS